MQLVPDADFVPGCQTPPAGHPGNETQLLRQVLPLNPGMQDEEDPAQGLTVRHSGSALDQLRRRLGQ
jgi:hypothetical protein